MGQSKLRSTLGAGDLTPQMAILGLVVQQGDSVSGIRRRLSEEFGSAHFGRSAASNNLRALAKKDLVRLVEKGPPGRPGFDRYEVTPEGVAYFRDWFLNIERLPMVRDVLRAKLQFGESKDLATRIEEARKAVETHRKLGDSARNQWRAERSALRRQSARGKSVSYEVAVASIQCKDEAKLLHDAADRFEDLINDLEELLHGGLPDEE